MTNENDKATQALDDFLRKVERWRGAVCVSNNEEAALAIAYDAWMDQRDPPGDPHKEWVNANKLKPNDVFQPVLVKTINGNIGLATWTPERNFDGVKRSWQVQLFMEGWYWTKEGITHWRYIPKDDND